MVLQRWQTVYLLISVIAMALAAAFPAVEPLRVAQPVVELGGAVLVARVLAAAIAVFLLVTITKFKNLKMQQMLCSVGVLLMLAEIAVVAGGYFMAVVDEIHDDSSAACACACLHADGEEPYPKRL